MKKRVSKRKKRNTAKAKLKQRIMQRGAQQDIKFVKNPAGMAKMSDMLHVLIEPYEDAADTKGAYTNLVGLATLAWNTAVLPPEKLDESLAFLDKMYPDAEDKQIAQSMLMEMMKRKLELFPDVNRMIVDFTITDAHDGWHLEVASTLPRPQT